MKTEMSFGSVIFLKKRIIKGGGLVKHYSVACNKGASSLKWPKILRSLETVVKKN